jgi:ADP-ribose pyrophosphatase
VADQLEQSQVNPDEDESIEVVPISIDEIEPMILDGRIKDAKSIAALLVALRFIS